MRVEITPFIRTLRLKVKSEAYVGALLRDALYGIPAVIDWEYQLL